MPVKVVTFGTSLTARGGWQQPLENALRACMKQSVSVESVARSGATSDWALTNVQEVVARRPDIVVIEFYANDAALNRFISVAHSRRNMAEVLGQLRRQLPNTRIIVMAMNPFIGLRGFLRPFIDHYIDAHHKLAEDYGVEFHDHRPAWARLSSGELSAAIPDGSHPKPQMASAIIVPGLVERITAGHCRN